MTRMAARDSSVIDQRVSARLKMRRRQLGLTQQYLSDKMGVTCQQVCKYESGVNRLSAGRLWHAARAHCSDREPRMSDPIQDRVDAASAALKTFAKGAMDCLAAITPAIKE